MKNKKRTITKRLMSVLIMTLMILGLSVPHVSMISEAASVESYSYSIVPLVNPLNNLYYVKTKNPDPTSFRLVDKSSKYVSKNTNSTGIIKFLDEFYIDVVYEVPATKRVKGGYIFYNYNEDVDGGELVLQKKNSSGNFVNTSVKVKCASVKNRVDYIIDTYTKDKKTFFDKMDAAQSGLYEVAVYPKAIRNKEGFGDGGLGYHLLASSPYTELKLNAHVSEAFPSGGSLLLSATNAFMLDSLGFPGMMSTVAKKLNKKATVERGSTHYSIVVTLNGTSRAYGGAGIGTTYPIYTDTVGKLFKFDGSSNDLAKNTTIKKVRNKYLEVANKSDTYLNKLEDELRGVRYSQFVAQGNWIRIGIEGSGTEGYGYALYNPWGNYAYDASDVWVDGRYIDNRERLVMGKKYKDHPQASIVVRKMSYTDVNGRKHLNDVVFSYDKATGTWRAPEYYSNGSYIIGEKLPSKFILTKSQVKAMKVDKNTNRLPDDGLVYDGSRYPGTPFKTVHVSGVKITKDIKINQGDRAEISVTFVPSNADWKYGTLKSAKPAIADVLGTTVYGYKKGKTTITVKTHEGGYTAKCNVTVGPPVSKITISKSFHEMKAGDTLKLSATLAPKNVLNKKVEWSSSDPFIASVDSNGKVVARKEGYVTIYASSGSKSDSCFIYVESGKDISKTVVKGKLRRIYGSNRYYTAFETGINYCTDKNTYRVDGAIIACGNNFPDALAASYLAKKKGIPIILAGPSNSEDVKAFTSQRVYVQNKTYVIGLGGGSGYDNPEEVFLLGGSSVVPNSVIEENRTYMYQRLAGATRYDTNIEILKAADFKSGELLICDGSTFQNALIASGTGLPILLVRKDGLTDNQKKYLSSVRITKATIIGNTNSVSKKVESQLKKYAQKVSRISASSTDEMSAKVAKAYFKNPTQIVLAISDNYPDALAGGPLAIVNKGPIFLISNSRYSYTKSYCKNLNIKRVTVLGGPSLISDATAKAIGKIK